jgi:ribosomal protein S18 acetylase RimI-like enzyme
VKGNGMFLYQKKLQKEYQDDVWEILCASEKEFIPPLSERDSTTQQSFSGEKANKRGLAGYYQQMLQQEFILAVEEEKAIGFLSFIPDHFLKAEGNEFVCDYVTTIVVSHGFRGRGIAGKMYHTLFENRKGKSFATRTWSTNYSHIHLLKKMGFELVALLPDERGVGIDTVYYFKGA